mgnify:CR=1 FL=1
MELSLHGALINQILKSKDDIFTAEENELNEKLGAIGFGNDIKTQLIDYGILKSSGLTYSEFKALNI